MCIAVSLLQASCVPAPPSEDAKTESYEELMSRWPNKSISLYVFGRINQKTNEALIYTHPTFVGAVVGKKTNLTGGNYPLKMDEKDKLNVVINNSEEHELKLIDVPWRSKSLYYGFKLPVEKAKDASFRLDFIRSEHQSVTGAAHFKFPVVLGFTVTNINQNKLKLVDNDEMNISFNISSKHTSHMISYKPFNDTCVFYKGSEKVATYTKQDTSVLRINWYPKKTADVSFNHYSAKARFSEYYGKTLLEGMAKVNKLPVSSELKFHCQGVVHLSLYSRLDPVDYAAGKTNNDYGIRGEKGFKFMNILMERTDSFAFEFTYQGKDK